MAEVAAQATSYVDIGLSLLGSGALGGLGILGFVRLRTEVRLYRDENQKDHSEMKDTLKEINGAGRTNTTAIAGIEARCNERHGKGHHE